MNKLEQLKALLQTFPGVIVGFSGGVDSTFLAVVAHQVLKDRFWAITAVSPTYSEHQLTEAKELALKYSLPHQVITTNECETAEFTANSPDRCYHCKKALFSQLQQIAKSCGDWAVLDGANLDDQTDYRPGHRATKELGIHSPLKEIGFTKSEIRQFSRELSIPTWEKPAYACLASRIPYGQPITLENLHRIDQAEVFLTGLGFRELRLRDHYPIARIEVGPTELEAAWQQRQAISAKLHHLGFPYVTLDLDGFRSGSMNEVLK